MPRSERAHPRHRGVYVVSMADGTDQYHLRPTIGGRQERWKYATLDEALIAQSNLRGLSSTIRNQRKSSQRIDADFLEHLMIYLQHLRTKESGGDLPDLAATTVQGYRKTVRYHLNRWVEENRWTTSQLSSDQLRAFCRHVGQGGNASYTNAAKFCQVLGRTLVELDFRDDNPASTLKAHADRRSTSSAPSRRARREASGGELWIPTSAELHAILRNVASPLHRNWFWMLAFTGMRPEEAAGLQWDRDVDLDGRVIRPTEPLAEVNGARVLLGVDVNDVDAADRIADARAQTRDAGKTPRWLRPIPIVDQLLPVLRELQERHRDERQPWVFPGRLTAKAQASCLGSFPHSYEFTQTAFRRASAEAGFHGLRQYDLRHHVAAELLHAGLSYERIAKVLGNSAATVEASYSHLRRADVEELQELMTQAFSRTAHDQHPMTPLSAEAQ